jgi:outer membrane receptor protein involved in Fe transport
VARGVGSGRYDATGVVCQTNCPANRPVAIANQFPTYEENGIKGKTYFDLNLTAKLPVRGRGNTEFFLNITNLFDTDPILLPETGLAANTTYSDLLGRAYRIGVRLRFK